MPLPRRGAKTRPHRPGSRVLLGVKDRSRPLRWVRCVSLGVGWGGLDCYSLSTRCRPCGPCGMLGSHPALLVRSAWHRCGENASGIDRQHRAPCQRHTDTHARAHAHDCSTRLSPSSCSRPGLPGPPPLASSQGRSIGSTKREVSPTLHAAHWRAHHHTALGTSGSRTGLP